MRNDTGEKERMSGNEDKERKWRNIKERKTGNDQEDKERKMKNNHRGERKKHRQSGK